jgi:selenocysteine lyase/cysteine desulfurase
VTAPYDVEQLRRREFPWAGETIYLNHAGIGPLPEGALRATEVFNRQRAAPYRLKDEQLFAILERARSQAARLIGAEPGEIALATNTSFGLNLAALMLPLAPGDIVIASRGEFPANVFTWRGLARRGVSFELVPLDARGWPDEGRLLDRMADPRVRVLALSSVQFQSGFAADLERFSRAARQTGTYLVIDAIQSLGQIPFDVRKTPVDILSCGAQKWLLSPWGTGFTYVRRDLVTALEPPLAGWMAFEGTEDFTRLCDYPTELRRTARRFELVTLAFQDFLGMNESLELLHELGIERIRRHLQEIGRPVLEWAERRGIPLASPVGERASGFICLAPPDAERRFGRLTEAGVVASFREGAIRLSPHCYNTSAEMARVAEILDR